MAGLRVRLQLLDDRMVNRKYWFFIDQVKNKTIQDVVEKINNRYSICCDRLCLKDAELHLKEDVAVLRDEDLIEVHCKQPDQGVPPSENEAFESSKVDEEITERPKKKKKKRDKDFVEAAEPQPVESSTLKPYQPEESVETKTVKPSQTKKNVLETSEVPVTAVESTINSPDDSDELMTPDIRSGRKRRRKRKSRHTKVIEPQVQYQEFFTAPEPVPEITTRKHIRFDESYTNGTVETSTPLVPKFVQPTIEAIQEFPQRFPKKTVTSVQTASATVPQELSALLSLRSAVFSRKIATQDEKLMEQKADEVPKPQITNGKPQEKPVSDPTKFPILKGTPRVGDVIAYKVLELTENYSPEVSGYRQGRIVEANPGGEITIEIIGQPVMKKHSRGKFELVEEGEEPENEDMEILPEVETLFSHHFAELIEPRLIYP